jgi:hypothetical protein
MIGRELRQLDSVGDALEYDPDAAANPNLLRRGVHNIRDDEKSGLFVQFDRRRHVGRARFEGGEFGLVDNYSLMHCAPAGDVLERECAGTAPGTADDGRVVPPPAVAAPLDRQASGGGGRPVSGAQVIGPGDRPGF